jgi:hypothetical protein
MIDSLLGRGAEVAVLLPRNTEPVHRASAPPMEDAEAGFGQTVPVVEDDALVRAALPETLRDLRYQIMKLTCYAMSSGGLRGLGHHDGRPSFSAYAPVAPRSFLAISCSTIRRDR